MSYVLYLDTTNNQKITVVLAGKKKYTLSNPVTFLKSQVILPLVEKILLQNNLKLSDISEIKVKVGPGSYTGIRVGLSVANTLAYVLGVKVNGKKQETNPRYE